MQVCQEGQRQDRQEFVPGGSSDAAQVEQQGLGHFSRDRRPPSKRFLPFPRRLPGSFFVLWLMKLKSHEPHMTGIGWQSDSRVMGNG